MTTNIEPSTQAMSDDIDPRFPAAHYGQDLKIETGPLEDSFGAIAGFPALSAKSTQAVMSDSQASLHDAIYGIVVRVINDQPTSGVIADDICALLVQSTGTGGEAAQILRHLKTAHAWLEEHVNGDASKGTIECNGVVWDIDESKAAIAAYELAPAQPIEQPFCVDCGDQIMAHNPGTCGTCHSIKYEQPMDSGDVRNAAKAMSDERAKFEEWCGRQGLDAKRFEDRTDEINGEYWYQEVLTGWRAWQARAALALQPTEHPPCEGVQPSADEELTMLEATEYDETHGITATLRRDRIEELRKQLGREAQPVQKPVAWLVRFSTRVGTDQLIVFSEADAAKQVRHELIESVTPLYAVPLSLSQQADAEVCNRCNGEGLLHTGISESPTTQCNKCDGTGEVHP